MDVERRLLLYVVALGCAVGLAALIRRRAKSLRAHAFQLVALAGAAAAGLLSERVGVALAWPLFWVWLAVAVAPSLLVQAARHAAGRRRFGVAWRMASVAAGILLLPGPIRREARLYAALDAGDRGDEEECRARLDEIAQSDAAGVSGVADLVDILPAVAARRWEDVLRAVDAAGLRSPLVLAAEAGAAAETGDVRRALRASEDLSRMLPPGSAALAHVRRHVLGSTGRVAFLEEALRKGLPVADGPPGAVALAIARALEASGETELAVGAFRDAAAAARGTLRRDAEEGEARCLRDAPRLASPDAAETAALHDLERVCRSESSDPSRLPIHRRAPATAGICAATVVVSGVALLVLGSDVVSLVAAGALSAPLVAEEGEWWRMASAMMLHGGWAHLLLNVTSVLAVGIPVEERIGAVRTVIVYVASGLLASVASVYGNETGVGVGASGAAMGMFGALAVLLVARGTLFDPAERRQWMGVAAVVLVANAAIGFLERQAIDNAAHGGGLVAGAAFMWILLPARTDSELSRGARRVLAVSLVALLAVAGGAVLRDVREWYRSAWVHARGATAKIPAWLRVDDAGAYGAFAVRRPLPFAVQLGRRGDAQPDPAALATRAFGEKDPSSARERWEATAPQHAFEAGLTVEEFAWKPRSDETDVPLRAVVVDRDGTFAAVLLPDNEEGRSTFGPTLHLIARTLRTTPERTDR